MEALPPTKISELKLFLGLISYYAKILPNLAESLAPLYQLLQKNQEWQWSAKQDEAYKDAKHLLTTS